MSLIVHTIGTFLFGTLDAAEVFIGIPGVNGLRTVMIRNPRTAISRP